MKKILLFSIMLILLSSFVFAADVTDIISELPDGGGAGATNLDGSWIEPKINGTIESIGVSLPITAPNCYIYRSSDNVLLSMSFLNTTSGICLFGNVTISTLDRYAIVAGGGTYNNRFINPSTAYPTIGTNVDWISRTQSVDGGSTWQNSTTIVVNVINVTTSTITSSLIPPAPVIESPSPADDTTWNTNITLNVSHTSSLADVRYWLYLSGDTSTLGEEHLYLRNVTRTAAEYRKFDTNLSDGTFWWKWQVQNASNGLFSENTSIQSFTIDTATPVITLNGGNSFNDSDTSLTNQYANFLNFNFTITDNNEIHGLIINVTAPNGTAVFEYVNFSLGMGNMTFNFTQNVSTSGWGQGVFIINISASDPHTAFSIDDYEIQKSFNKLNFNTAEGNEIEISSGGSVISTNYEKLKDRYEFGFNYLLESDTRTFAVKSKNKIYYLPNSQYAGHFVIYSDGVIGNWIDFEGIDGTPSVTKINDKEYRVTFTDMRPSKKIIAKSLGSTNVASKKYFWYNGNFTTIVPPSSTFGNTETFSLNISRNLSFVIPNASFIYDGVEQDVDFTFNDEYITFSSDVTITQPDGNSETINLSWDVNITQQDNSIYSFDVERSINVSLSILDNCSIYNTTVLTITGRDEETNEDVLLDLNIFFDTSNAGNLNASFELSGSTNYTFCSDVSENFTVSSIMEYGDTVIYADRKYYLNDFQLDITSSSEVFLYHLNTSKASEITFTVFDSITGDKVRDAFIEILRYYPGENVFRVVEIAKTDETGKSLGKMVLADVFYKFIIKKPAGTIKLDTGTLKILSLTRSFGIQFAADPLDTWKRIQGVDSSTTCTKSTKTCRVTWSDTSSVVQDVTLEVWRANGLADELLFTNTLAAASGTISYTIVEDVTGNRYVAKSFVESNTGFSTYPLGLDAFFDSLNPFFTDPEHRLASIFPLLMLGIVLVFVFLDFGAVGVIIGGLLILVVGSISQILPLNPFYFTSMIVMGVILLYKLSR